ncbi:SWIM zinc finger domain-containing protein [Lachnospiraceae bacterium ZAX-1]
MELTQSYIDSLAPNANTISNAKGLAANKFQKLCVSQDDTLLFGECVGSGKNPYKCSVDFIDKENPIARCSCPSRQIPCKHAMGLLYAYLYAYNRGKSFSIEEVPADITEKRGKIEKRAETKEKKIADAKMQMSDATAQNPDAQNLDAQKLNAQNPKVKNSKAKITAARKKINVQLEGIDVAEKLLNNIVKTGIASIDAAMRKTFDEQVKQLGNYYIGGIQTAFHDILLHLKMQNGDDYSYSDTISSLLYMGELIKKSREHLKAKHDSENPLTLFTSSAIEEQIGHVWKLEELIQCNRYIETVEMAQLTFYSYSDDARREFVDESLYIELHDGNIYKTVNYRPYKALKYVKADDSHYDLIKASEVFVYPGDVNPRVRWNKYTMEPLTMEHVAHIKSLAKSNFAETQKAVKNQIRNPLSDKNPLYLLSVSDIQMIKNDEEEQLHIIDEHGTKQLLMDTGYIDVKSMPFVKRLDKKLLIGGALLVMFANDIDAGLIAAKPLAAITDGGIVRFIY